MTQNRHSSVTLNFSPKVLWTASAIALVSGLWQIGMFFKKWNFLLDMEVYRAGARAFLDNQPLYSAPFNVRGVVLPFIYPPFGAAILSPFAMVSSHFAAASVLLISAVLTFVCIYAITQALIADKFHAFVFAAMMWPLALLSEPHTSNAGFGQINVLVMALCVLDLVPRRRWLPQGTLIGLAAAIKLTPVALCLFFLLKKDFKAISWAALSGITVTTITACFRLTATIQFFTETVFKMNSTKEAGVSTAYMTNQSIKGMLMRWAPSEQSAQDHQGLIDIIWLVFVVLSVLAIARLMILMFRRGMEVDAALLNAGLMLIISPISWSHHWVWMPLFALVLLYRWLSTPGNPVLLGICAGVTWLFCLQIKPHWIFGDLGGEMYSFGVVGKLIISGYLWLMLFIVISLFIVMKDPIKKAD